MISHNLWSSPLLLIVINSSVSNNRKFLQQKIIWYSRRGESEASSDDCQLDIRCWRWEPYKGNQPIDDQLQDPRFDFFPLWLVRADGQCVTSWSNLSSHWADTNKYFHCPWLRSTSQFRAGACAVTSLQRMMTAQHSPAGEQTGGF